MERLRHSDFSQLLDFVAGLQEPVALADLGRHIVRLTSELLPEATIAFDQINESGGQYGFDHNIQLDPADQVKVLSRLREVYQQNPVYRYIQGGGKGPLVDISDLATRRELHRTDFYQDIFRPYDIEHQLCMLLPREGWISTLTINSERAFTGRMKTLLTLASRHIDLAHRSACQMDRIAQAAAAAAVTDGAGVLTAREAEVFAWLREGKRNSEIGMILGCSGRTIDKHVQNILRKTGAETRTAAVRVGL